MHLVLFMDDTGNSEDEVHLVSSSSSGKYYGNHSLDDNVPADEDCVDAVVHSRKWYHTDQNSLPPPTSHFSIKFKLF